MWQQPRLTPETKQLSWTKQDAAEIAPNGDFTFGVEFEYMFVSPKDRPSRDHYDTVGPNEYAKATIRETLSWTLSALCTTCNKRVPFQLPLRHDPLAPREWLNDFSDWVVCTETMMPSPKEVAAVNSSGKIKAEDYDWCGVEIKSRVLHGHRGLEVKTASKDHVHEISYAEEINAVLKELKNRFTTFKKDIARTDYLYPNEEAGFHVHVGNNLDGLSLQTIKKVLCLNLAFERQIDSIQANHRIGGTDLGIRPLYYPEQPFPSNYTKTDPSVYNIGLADGFLYHAYNRRKQAAGIVLPARYGNPVYPASAYDDTYVWKARHGLDLDSWMVLVSNAPDIDALLDLYTSYQRNTIVNIKQMNPRMNPYVYKKTIEFRQARSTMQPEAAMSWLTFVVTMVGYCESNTMAALLAFLTPEGRQRQPSFHFAMLCETIGCDPGTVDHFSAQLAGDYARDLRRQEEVYAYLARSRGQPLADLALHSIRKERKDVVPRHVQQRIRSKLMMGGYGQFTREYIDDVVGAANFLEQETERVTLGYESPVHSTVHRTPMMTLYDSAQSYEDEVVALNSFKIAPSETHTSDSDESRGRTTEAPEHPYGPPPPEMLLDLSEQMEEAIATSFLSPANMGSGRRSRSPSTALSVSSSMHSDVSGGRSRSRSARSR